MQQSLREVLPGIPQTPAAVMKTEPPSEKHPPTTAPLPALEAEDVAGEPESKLDQQSLVDFETLLSQSEAELKDKDVDAFWEKLSLKGQPGPAANADALSYDQARKLGLAPNEDPSPQPPSREREGGWGDGSSSGARPNLRA